MKNLLFPNETHHRSSSLRNSSSKSLVPPRSKSSVFQEALRIIQESQMIIKTPQSSYNEENIEKNDQNLPEISSKYEENPIERLDFTEKAERKEEKFPEEIEEKVEKNVKFIEEKVEKNMKFTEEIEEKVEKNEEKFIEEIKEEKFLENAIIVENSNERPEEICSTTPEITDTLPRNSLSFEGFSMKSKETSENVKVLSEIPNNS